MREILFRGKRYMDGEWVDGSLFIDEKKEKHEILVGYVNYRVGWEVIPETVGQYTGLTDKNGKKIFEGDYWLETNGDYLVYVVEFRDGQFGFVCYGITGVLMPYGYDETAGGFDEIDFNPFTDFYMDKIEIIGNIHDNPEVMKWDE